MKKLRHAFFGFIFGLSVLGYAEVKVSDAFVAQEEVSQPKIRVLLLEERTTALIEAKGPHHIYGDNVLLRSHSRGSRLAVHALYDGIHWGENFANVECLKIEPVGDSATLFVNGIQYKGSVYIRQTGSRCIAVVNELSIEDYLKSVLSVRYLKELDKEALSACVILERTSLYEKLLEKHPQSFWHVSAQEEQYLGFGVTKQMYGVEEAVDWTSRLVLDNPEGLFMDADALLQSNVDCLAIEGFNARQILEKFYVNADFVVIDSWSEDVEEIS